MIFPIKIHKANTALEVTKFINKVHKFVVLFPDERNYHKGLGINLIGTSKAEQVYQEASDITKTNVLKLCTTTPREELAESLEKSFIATYVTNHAALQKYSVELPHNFSAIRGSGGIGIGFLNSLVHCGVISFADGLALAKLYGQSMERAASIVPSGRLIIRLRPATSREKICRSAIEHCLSVGIPKEIAVCSIVATIRSQLIIVAGHDEAIRYLEENGIRLFDFKEMRRDPRRSDACFSDLMLPASMVMKAYLEQERRDRPDFIKEFRDCRIYSTISGRRLMNADQVFCDLFRFPVESLKIEQMLGNIYRRPANHEQPNTIIFWDKFLLKTLQKINFKAYSKAKVFEA